MKIFSGFCVGDWGIVLCWCDGEIESGVGRWSLSDYVVLMDGV